MLVKIRGIRFLIKENVFQKKNLINNSLTKKIHLNKREELFFNDSEQNENRQIPIKEKLLKQ